MNVSMKNALKNMRMRLALICVITTGILLCVTAVVLLRIAENQMDIQRNAALSNSANSVIYRLQSSSIIDSAWLSQLEASGRFIIHIEDNTRPISFRGSWTTVTERNTLVSIAHEKALSEYGFDVNARPVSVLRTEDVSFEMRGENNERYLVFISIIPAETGRQSLTMLKDLENDIYTIFLLRMSFFGVILVALIFLLIFSLLFSKRATAQIEESNKKHIEFIAAASHELRAPLAVVKASVSEAAFDPKYQEVAGREIGRMARLIDELLLLANADAQKLTVQSGAVDFDTILTELYENFGALAKNKNQRLTLALPETALPIISGDKQRIIQALTAILDNALAYTPEGGVIAIEAKQSKRVVTIEISDSGPGVPESEKLRIFDRFFRADSSRRDKEHYGLGLSVAKEIIELHNGKVAVSDAIEGGALFTVKFFMV